MTTLNNLVSKLCFIPCPSIDKSKAYLLGIGKSFLYICIWALLTYGWETCNRWADVPTTKHTNLFVELTGCLHGSPSVKYRGIFLNDEQPALQNWAAKRFTNGTGAALTGSPFNHFFYTKM